MTIGVYVIEHVATGRRYVGKSVDVCRRIQEHFAGCGPASSRIRRAILKYGTEAFTWDLLEECDTDEEAREREVVWIRALRTTSPRGFNLTEGGDGRAGLKHSVETRAKMSAALVGNQRALGHRHTEESRAKMSAALLGRSHTAEARAKNAISHLGRRHTEASLEKMRARRPTDETRAKLSAARLGKKFSDETREKLRRAWARRKEVSNG